MELLMQKREQLWQGYVMEEHGGTFGMAIRTHDISIPSYREDLRKRGLVQLTQDNGASHVAALVTAPPSIETCQQVVEAIAERREAMSDALLDEIKELQTEMSDPALGRDERGYMRLQVQRLEQTLHQIDWEAENVTAEFLYRFFREENIKLRAAAVPPEMREALQVLRDEETLYG